MVRFRPMEEACFSGLSVLPWTTWVLHDLNWKEIVQGQTRCSRRRWRGMMSQKSNLFSLMIC